MTPEEGLPVELMGAPGSPYTRKMLALLRYRRIPHVMLWGSHTRPAEGYPEPKVKLLPTFYFRDPAGRREAVVDSTFIIRRLETITPERSVVPDNRVLWFLDLLVEDFADEWLTKAMFHYRWAYEADIANAGPVLTFWQDPTMDDATAQKVASFISERQVSRLYVVGSNETTAQTIEDSYLRTLSILDRLVQAQGYVLGRRPSAADFALYGQLTQLAIVDPTPAQETGRRSPRIRSWIDRVDDLSGLDPTADDWMDPVASGTSLKPLLSEIGRVYVPFLLANAQAAIAGQEQFETTIDGRPWVQPTFPYQAKCLTWIREAYATLAPDEKALVDDLFKDTGCAAIID